MADTLEFAHVAFPRARFDPSLLAELLRVAPNVVELAGDQLILEHLYIERRLTPLNLYLANPENEAQIAEALGEYGNAIRELANANIFPGDLLLKNFGMTRYGRVVFYDYDEICNLTDCRFRPMPRPRDDEEEMGSEPWYNVEKNDVFPEQFPTFLVPPGRPRQIFMEHNADLADAGFWTRAQERVREGVVEDLFPYAQEIRFENRYGPTRPL